VELVSLSPGVSAREAEVLEAVAEHLTNAEIGARLFISIRTVESHVSSLLRKLGAQDRRGLVRIAESLQLESAAPGEPGNPARVAVQWPSPLTAFVGRTAERVALAEALGSHRLVTAIGPGGVGKTRLAQVVAADMAGRYADGAWYVDLVPVTDQAMVAPAVAASLGLGEQQGRSAEDTVLGWLDDRHVLLVLDNCEHLASGVVLLVERLLAHCPRLVVLATSRARLRVPYEWVFTVPGMSVSDDGGGAGDAVALFLARAKSSGSTAAAATDQDRIEAICRGLDGIALAIELAAARLPALGLDGLEAGLADRLRLLAGGPRIDDRHRSLRSALDWSFALLDRPEQAVLRMVSVFAAPFTVGDAVMLASGWPAVAPSDLAAGLATLADQSLLVAIAGRQATRYLALETIRQYAAERLAEAGELADMHARHVGWCLRAGAALGADTRPDAGAWRSAFDRIADELRSALGWAASRQESRAAAYQLAMCLAELSFSRGMPGESQRRYEQAADLAETAAAAAHALHFAAGAAAARHFGDDVLRLHRSAADAALRAGDPASAARDLAQAAEFINRAFGLIANIPPDGAVDALLAEARELAAGDPVAVARIGVAEAFAGPEDGPATAEATEQALELARRAGDLLAESAALDQLTAVQLARGAVREAAASALRRTKLLAALPIRADAGLEVSDAFCMAADTAVAAGDMRAARGLAERVRDLPFHREEAHLATARLLVVTALAGDWDETIAFGQRYVEGWERAGRPHDGNLNRGAYAAATVHGLRGDDSMRAAWIEISRSMTTPAQAKRDLQCYEFFDALLLLHRGQHDAAMRRLATQPENFTSWQNGQWRPWHAALWAEAAVLSGHADVPDRLRRARLATAGNPIAAAIVTRAAALANSDRMSLLAAATELTDAGCHYQWARTLMLAGGRQRARGRLAMADIGATDMATSVAVRGLPD
jgi:predicted ATPase/DNA-binding CsgD family transcriptional regulator